MIHMKQSDPDSSTSTGDLDVDSEANAASYLTRFVAFVRIHGTTKEEKGIPIKRGKERAIKLIH